MNSVNKKAIILLVIMLVISGGLLVYFSSDYQKLRTVANKVTKTQLIKSYTCEHSNCYDLKVVCENLEPTNLTIKETLVENPKASLIMATSNTGNQLYSEQSSIANETLNLLLHSGANTYELAWKDGYGWATNAEGKGLIAASCRFAEATTWISEHIRKAQINTTKICATGNAEAAQLLGNGLVFYNLENTISTAILTGGPPFSKTDIACFGDIERPDAKLEGDDANKALIDYLMGWQENGNYCTTSIPATEARILAESAGLISENPKADYFYNTNTIFINSNDETNADDQGKIYYDQISSGKEWIKISGTRHDVQNTREGAEILSNILIRECLN